MTADTAQSANLEQRAMSSLGRPGPFLSFAIGTFLDGCLHLGQRSPRARKRTTAILEDRRRRARDRDAT
jgi:hypothetical protein